MNVLEKLQINGILPVVVINDAKQAEDLASAVIEGGLNCLEITFRTEAAPKAIRRIKNKYPNLVIGAGTVLNEEQLNLALSVGADFIVSPAVNTELIAYCVQHDITIYPGCSTPTDIANSLNLGLKTLKFYPCELSGGLKALKSFAATYPDVKFIPTGGINANNVADYLAASNVVACGGSWLVPTDLIDKQDFSQITTLVKEAIKAMFGFKLAHVGINCNALEEAKSVAKVFEQMFAFTPNENPGSIFADSYIEVLKRPFLGGKGHIAIATYSVERAKRYLESQGVEFNEKTINYEPTGKIRTVYLQHEVGGFAVHLIRSPKVSN